MSDFTSLVLSVNAGTAVTDASPTWSDMTFGGANFELRACGSGAGGASIASASWPMYLRPGSTGVIPEIWAYLGSDASGGLQLKTYDGTTAHYMQLRIKWDSLGTFASSPIISAWKDNTYPAASPGTQPSPTAGGDGTSIVNGHATDTSSTSYLKANAFGYGVDTGGTQQTPASNAGGTMVVTTGTAGAVNPGTGAWLATWQSLQASTQYIQDAVIPKATTSGFWYFLIALWTGPSMTGGTLLPVLGFQYSWV